MKRKQNKNITNITVFSLLDLEDECLVNNFISHTRSRLPKKGYLIDIRWIANFKLYSKAFITGIE